MSCPPDTSAKMEEEKTKITPKPHLQLSHVINIIHSSESPGFFVTEDRLTKDSQSKLHFLTAILIS
jgi:hypothetical protein